MLNKKIEEDRYIALDIITLYHLSAIYAFLGDKEKAYKNLRLLNQKQRMPKWMSRNFNRLSEIIEAKYQVEHERVREWLEENDML